MILIIDRESPCRSHAFSHSYTRFLFATQAARSDLTVLCLSLGPSRILYTITKCSVSFPSSSVRFATLPLEYYTAVNQW